MAGSQDHLIDQMQPHHWRTEGSQLPAAAYSGSLDHAANVHNAPHPLLPVVMGPGKLHLHRLLPDSFPDPHLLLRRPRAQGRGGGGGAPRPERAREARV